MGRSLLLSTAILLSLSLLMPTGSRCQPANNSNNQPAATLTAEYTAAMQAKEWPRAVTAAQQLVALQTTSQNLRQLAAAQLNSGAFDEALATYDRALSSAEKEKPAEGQTAADWQEGLARIYAGRGNTLLKLKRIPEAVQSYYRSAELAANPGQAYFNICAVLYNSGTMQDVPAACRKSLLADPKRADAWFLLGSALFVNSPTDAKANYVISTETRQALEKYLELAPDGPHAADVKAMLEMAAKQ